MTRKSFILEHRGGNGRGGLEYRPMVFFVTKHDVETFNMNVVRRGTWTKDYTAAEREGFKLLQEAK